MATANRRFFTTSEVARYFGVTSDCVLRWIHAGKLPAFATPGGHHRIGEQDFRAFLRASRIPVDESFFDEGRWRSVLIVAEAPAVRRWLGRVLARACPKVETLQAADGYEAGIRIGSRPPALVVIDASGSDIDGPALCRSLRANPPTRRTPVLAVVPGSGPELARRMHAAGADRCLAGPLAARELAREARRLLGTRADRSTPPRRARRRAAERTDEAR